MAIKSAGIGSGLDVENIISSLLAVESQPIVTLQQKKSLIDVKISAFGKIQSQLDTFKGVVDGLSDEKSFEKVSASSSNSDVLNVTSSNLQSIGNYKVDVQSLAKVHILNSPAYENVNTFVGEGDLLLRSGSQSLNLTIDATNNTLAGIRDEINNAEGNNFITASTIITDTGTRLILTASNTGVDNAIEVSVSNEAGAGNIEEIGLSALSYQSEGIKNLVETQAATNSSFTVNGFSVTNQGNDVSDVIEGINFDLKEIGSSTISVVRNIDFIESELKSLVNAYNETIRQNNALKEGPLSGDNLVLSIERSLRGVLNQQFLSKDSDFRNIYDVGLSFSSEGILSLDSTKFNDAIKNNLSGIQKFLTDDSNGFATRLSDVLSGYTNSTGILNSKNESFESQIDSIDDRILNINFRLTQTEERLRDKFASLDTLIGSSLQTSSFLSNNLSGFNVNNKSSSK